MLLIPLTLKRIFEMNKYFLLTLSLALPNMLTLAHAQGTPLNATIIAPTETTWTSKDSTDTVTINNGSGNILTVTIFVDKNNGESSGVNISNCGETTHIDAGSSAICTNTDAGNPVNFTSDSASTRAKGTYTIKSGQ